MNNSSRSLCFIPLYKVGKHKEYNVSISQVELKLNYFTLLDAHTPPTYGAAWRVCVCGLPSMCVCATSSLETKSKQWYFLTLSAFIFNFTKLATKMATANAFCHNCEDSENLVGHR